MKLAELIIEKCERSRSDWREGKIGNRSLRIQQKDLDSYGKRNLLQQAEYLERIGLIRCKWILDKSDIAAVQFSLEDLSKIYEIIGRIPKNDYLKNRKSILETHITKLRKQWIKAYYCDLLNKLEAGKVADEIDNENIELNLNCFLGIDKLDYPVYKRIFSKQYLDDSKLFEKKMQITVIAAAKKFNDAIDDSMSSKEILNQINLDDYSSEMSLKGNLKLKINDLEIDLSLFPYGAILNSDTLKIVTVPSGQRIRKIITIENKANYIMYPYEADTLVIFSHGYFSPYEKNVLEKLVLSLNESEVEYYHSGDLDYGGIQIFEYIKRIMPKLKPLQMNIETWGMFNKYGYIIEESKRKKLKSIINNGKITDPDIKKLALVIYETGIGIEQESFLFTD